MAKYEGRKITTDWYKAAFLNESLPTDDIMIHAGLNKKTIFNAYGTTRREIVIDVSEEHYDQLYEIINKLSESSDLNIKLGITFQDVMVNLDLTERLIVINALAVKRAQIRGGLWSTSGKQVEIPLMRTLAELFQVPPEYYGFKITSKEGREVDFHFIDPNGRKYFCEVKLMGKGNPESADAAIARDTEIFVADTLSSLNKTQLTQRGKYWVALHDKDGYRRLYTILRQLDIPAQEFTGDLEERLEEILASLFGDGG